MEDYKWPKEYPVQYHLAGQFLSKALAEGCKQVNVIEQITCNVLLYVLDVPDGKEELISDLAFMTHIKNPKFQKYYTLTPELLAAMERDFEIHVSSRMEKEEPKIANIQTEAMDDQVLVRLILAGQYPFRSKDGTRWMYLYNDKIKRYFGSKDPDTFNKYWTREIYYLGEGQLSDNQLTKARELDYLIEGIGKENKPEKINQLSLF